MPLNLPRPNERPPNVRRRRPDLAARVNGNLALEFKPIALTSYAGVELFGRKVPNCYPILAHVAETTHVFRVKNRSGNVHDGKAAVPFLREAWPWETAPRFVIRDRDHIYGSAFRQVAHTMGIEHVPTAPRAPWQNPFVERVIGSIWRECLDHVIVWNERSSRRDL